MKNFCVLFGWLLLAMLAMHSRNTTLLWVNDVWVPGYQEAQNEQPNAPAIRSPTLSAAARRPAPSVEGVRHRGETAVGLRMPVLRLIR